MMQNSAGIWSQTMAASDGSVTSGYLILMIIFWCHVARKKAPLADGKPQGGAYPAAPVRSSDQQVLQLLDLAGRHAADDAGQGVDLLRDRASGEDEAGVPKNAAQTRRDRRDQRLLG